MPARQIAERPKKPTPRLPRSTVINERKQLRKSQKFTSLFNAHRQEISLIFKQIFKLVKYTPTILKAIGKWFIKAVKESIAQIFTLLGFFIAWFTLTGTAQDIVGIAIIISTVIWLLTIRLRD